LTACFNKLPVLKLPPNIINLSTGAYGRMAQMNRDMMMLKHVKAICYNISH